MGKEKEILSQLCSIEHRFCAIEKYMHEVNHKLDRLLAGLASERKLPVLTDKLAKSEEALKAAVEDATPQSESK